MGLFGKLFGKKDRGSLKQDRNDTGKNPDGPFIMHLMMSEKCEMPDKAFAEAVMKKHLGDDTDCFAFDKKAAGFAPKRYMMEFKDAELPAQLMITQCSETGDFTLDSIARTQLWDCPEGEEILDRCKYHVIAMDMMGNALDYKDRADMLMHFLDALMELFPTCEAVVFDYSCKMFTREDIINCDVPDNLKFIRFTVNMRYFRIEGTDDMLVDSLGMNVLGLPDVQYHFHGFSPNSVIYHGQNLLSYLFDTGCTIESGETVDGLIPTGTDNDGLCLGDISRDVQWKCQFEQSLIQPVRPLMDINMGEYASGGRQ